MKEFCFALGSTETGAVELGIGVYAETPEEALKKLKAGLAEEMDGTHLDLSVIDTDFAWGELHFNPERLTLDHLVCTNEIG